MTNEALDTATAGEQVEPEDGQPAQLVVQVPLRDLVESMREAVLELGSLNYQVAVPLKTAAQMLGMKDTGFVEDLIHAGRLRCRQEPGKKTKLVSVASIRQYMGDEPKPSRRGGR